MHVLIVDGKQGLNWDSTEEDSETENATTHSLDQRADVQLPPDRTQDGYRETGHVQNAYLKYDLK